MDIMEVIRGRKSFRTFDGRMVSDEDRERISSYAAAIRNPYGIPVEFVMLDAEEHGLSSPVIRGERLYIAAKVPRVDHCEEAYGYSFEMMVLYAWSLGVGTTWMGGTLNRELFEKAANTGGDEFMMIASPLGYPSPDRSDVDVRLRSKVRGDERLPASELFYENDFSSPLNSGEDWAEAVRWAPSAANLQPWRIVISGSVYHFYEKHCLGYTRQMGWDVQKIDLGIALCHFMKVAGGRLLIEDPGIAVEEDMEYIASVDKRAD